MLFLVSRTSSEVISIEIIFSPLENFLNLTRKTIMLVMKLASVAGTSVFNSLIFSVFYISGTNSWSSCTTQKNGLSYVFNLFVYKNTLVVCGEDGGQLSLAMLDLDGIEFTSESLEEEEHFEYWFLNEEGSDITFKIQGKTLPAHKQVLIQNPRYFADLFSSNHYTNIISKQSR